MDIRVRFEFGQEHDEWMLDAVPRVGDPVELNGRQYVVQTVMWTFNKRELPSRLCIVRLK